MFDFNFVITSIIWILALYGLIEIIKTICLSYAKIKFKNDGIFVIIAAKNQENKIEGFMRSLLFRLIYGKEEYIKNIYVVDLNSTDNTYKILEKLQTEYSEIRICDWNTCKYILEKKV